MLLLLLFSIVVVMGEIGDCDYVDVDCILRFLGERIVIFLKRFRKPQKYIFDLLTIILLDFGNSIYYFLIFIYKY